MDSLRKRNASDGDSGFDSALSSRSSSISLEESQELLDYKVSKVEVVDLSPPLREKFSHILDSEEDIVQDVETPDLYIIRDRNTGREIMYKPPSRLSFSKQPQIGETYSAEDYNRCNPIPRSQLFNSRLQLELEKQVAKLDLLEVNLLMDTTQVPPPSLGIRVIGVNMIHGVPDKLNIYVKKVMEGSVAGLDGRIWINDHIVEVNGISLVGVSQKLAAEALSSCAINPETGVVNFVLAREKEQEQADSSLQNLTTVDPNLKPEPSGLENATDVPEQGCPGIVPSATLSSLTLTEFSKEESSTELTLPPVPAILPLVLVSMESQVPPILPPESQVPPVLPPESQVPIITPILPLLESPASLILTPGVLSGESKVFIPVPAPSQVPLNLSELPVDLIVKIFSLLSIQDRSCLIRVNKSFSAALTNAVAAAVVSSGDQGSLPSSGDQGSPPSSGDQGSPPSSGDQGSLPSSGDQGSPPSSGDQESLPSSGDQGSPPSSGDQGSLPSSDGHESPPIIDNPPDQTKNPPNKCEIRRDGSEQLPGKLKNPSNKSENIGDVSSVRTPSAEARRRLEGGRREGVNRNLVLLSSFS